MHGMLQTVLMSCDVAAVLEVRSGQLVSKGVDRGAAAGASAQGRCSGGALSQVCLHCWLIGALTHAHCYAV
jgi:hypothetical protein